MSSNHYKLIADIGGTNARFALLEGGNQTPIEPLNLVCEDYPNIGEAVRAYLDTVPFAKPHAAAMVVATVVTHDYLNMTNNNWEFSVAETCNKLGLR